ncbi:DUF5666 domain-containing protein [Actinomadura livida]|uniref:DUF5666 domain-containing protein n=1 Tax=Actinomadura livida TaxID=79909 RepID=A0A7W7MVM6_9ACTN|nr:MULTISPECIES: DUF5666 domain-containing protein [Actinomadura]MBB4771952.1 hypothetical protein [Actinomadura catellatispora]GGU03634.1 hypothetical protein GCM10010208_29760 [Actinomadura livida]
MRTDRKSFIAGLGAAGILGLGLYVAVPAIADSPSPSPTAKPSEKGGDRPFRDGPRRVRPGLHGPGEHGFGRGGGRGVHGEATVRDGDGFRLVTFQRGEITALSSTTLTVKSADGTSWTWTANGDTKIREDRKDVALKDLAKNDEVRIAGERSGDTRTAKLVRVRD